MEEYLQIFDENHKSDLAIKYLQESLRLDELSNNYNGMYLSSMKLAEIQLVKNSEKALTYMKNAYAYASETGDAFYEVSSLLALGDFYYNKKDFQIGSLFILLFFNGEYNLYPSLKDRKCS